MAQKGMGAFYIKKGINILPLLHGGHHENYRRAGTENVPGIIGLGVACEIAKKELLKNKIKITDLRNKLESLLITTIPDININGHQEKRVSNTLNISIKDVVAHDLLIMLDQDGFCLSAGSACSTGIPEPSHVLKAMTIHEDLLDCSIRISLGKYNTEKEIKLLAKSLQKNIKKIRQISKKSGND